MRQRMERVHGDMHGFVSMGGAHISFRDPFVFLLHSNVDRLFARWQTDPAHPERLDPETLYGSESNGDIVASCRKNDGEILFQNVNHQVEPWSTGHSLNSRRPGAQSPCREFFIRPWFAPENQGNPHTYKHPSIVTPPQYDTNFPPPTIGQGVLIQLGANSIVGVTGFYNIDDKRHIVVVGTTNGRVHEIFWKSDAQNMMQVLLDTRSKKKGSSFTTC